MSRGVSDARNAFDYKVLGNVPHQFLYMVTDKRDTRFPLDAAGNCTRPPDSMTSRAAIDKSKVIMLIV